VGRRENAFYSPAGRDSFGDAPVLRAECRFSTHRKSLTLSLSHARAHTRTHDMRVERMRSENQGTQEKYQKHRNQTDSDR
jgi:hypothetical protein